MKIYVLNGPNLNLLGTREPALYGSTTLADVQAMCASAAQRHGHEAVCLQSNHEGELIDRIHEAGHLCKANTHTSVALHDAIKGVDALPVIEVHISNVHARESFRHHSFISPAAAGIIVGFGVDGYVMAIDALARRAAAVKTT